MKILFNSSLFALLLCTALLVNAQVPQGIPYQAVARNAAGEPMANKPIKVRFSILDSLITGNAVYVETHNSTTSGLGLFVTNVGMGTPTTGTFININWGQNFKFLKVELDTTASGNNYINLGTQQMMSVPYALYSSSTSNGLPAGGTQGQSLTLCNGVPTWTTGGLCPGTGTITALNCAAATNTGTLTQSVAASGVIITVAYSGGNGGTHNGQTVISTGVTGLTATLATGSFANGTGSLTYSITGTPLVSGIANFALNIGGQLCVLNVTVNNDGTGTYPAGSLFCTTGPTIVADVINPITGKTWMDRNLGATQVATSSTSSTAYGDLYQWGRLSDGHQCRNSSTINTLSSTDQPGNSSFILTPAGSSSYDWRNPQNANLWQGIIGINNPCPTNYRIPTEAEFDAERQSWGINNNSAGAFTSPLKLTVGGYRSGGTGSFSGIGGNCNYWTSTVIGNNSKLLSISNINALFGVSERSNGLSIRCIKDTIPAGSIGSLSCASASLVGSLTQGVAASGVTVSVPYTGGNGGSFNGQTISSTGVTGLTATLTAGVVSIGSGSLSFVITGTPYCHGTANFALSVLGKNCTLSIPVIPNGSFFCLTGPTALVPVLNPITGKTWMDRNLGALQVANSLTDANAYGDLYQWGRLKDGHQCRNSLTTTLLSSSDQPSNSNYIVTLVSPIDWRSPQNNNLWQGLNGINNPCPTGFRIPTENELEAERLSWSTNDGMGAYNSPLKLTLGGSRNNASCAPLLDVGGFGYYWSSTVAFNSYSRYLLFDMSGSSIETDNRVRGGSVRCIQD